MISRVLIIFLITTTVKCLNYDRVPRLVKNKTVDYRVSLRQMLRLPDVNRPPFNLFKSREEFVKLAEQNIKNYKPYNYQLYRPYNPSKPTFIYDRDYVTKVLSSLGLLRPLQNVSSNPGNTVNSSTESPKPLNNSFESNERETITSGTSTEYINTTTNSYTEQTTDAAISITEDAERTTELTTKSLEFSTHTTEGTNIPNYSTTESVTESNRIESTTSSNTEKTILLTTNSYTILTPNTEDSSTTDEEIIVQSSTDSFDIANATDILSYSSSEPVANAETEYTTEISIKSATDFVTESNRIESTTNCHRDETLLTVTDNYTTQASNPEDSSTEDERTAIQSSADSFGVANTTEIFSFSSMKPVTNAETQYTTEISTTERIGTENENLLHTDSNPVETTTISTTQDGFNPTTSDVGALITQFGHVPTLITEDAERTTELTTESFNLPTNTAQETDFPNYSTTESRTESIRINQTTTDANTEEIIFTTTDSYTIQTSNTEDSSTADEGIIVQASTDSFGIANAIDISSYSSTEPVANAEVQYTTEIQTTERIETVNENLLLTGSKPVETITTSNTQDGFNPTTPNVAEFMTQFGNIPASIAEYAERTTGLTTESFILATHTTQETDFPNYSTTEPVTESNRKENTTDSNTEETIYTTTTTASAPDPKDSSTANEETITQFSTTSFVIATITDILGFSSTEPATNVETQHTTEISTSDCTEPAKEDLLFTDANRVETATEKNFDPISTDATGPITQFGSSEDVEDTTALTTESFSLPTNGADVTNISNYSTPESVTESNGINKTTANAYTRQTIFTTTDSYTTVTPNAVTVNEETKAQASTESVGIAITADILSYSSTETATRETVYATEISTTDCMKPEIGNLVLTNANRIQTTTTSNTKEEISPTTNRYPSAFKSTTENFLTLNALDVEQTTELTLPSVWTTTNRVDGTDILDYSTKEPVTSPETTILNLETENAYFMFTQSNEIETATATDTDQGIHATTDSFTKHTVNGAMTLSPNVIGEPITEPAMENWDIETTTKTDILEYFTTESILFASTVNPNDTVISRIESLTTETNRMETITADNDNNVIHATTSNYEDQSNANPAKTTYETENYTTSEAIDVELTQLEFNIEPIGEICEETTETEVQSETIVQSETTTAEQFEYVTSTTVATEYSIDVTTELNEKITTEQESIMLSTTNNINLEDPLGTTTQISKEIELLADLQPTSESDNEISTQALESTSINKDITESANNVVLGLWNMSTIPLLEDVTTEEYKQRVTLAVIDNSSTQNALLSTITEVPTLSTTVGNNELTTEISQTESTTEMIGQVEETTIEAESEITSEKSTTEFSLTEFSDMETATEEIQKIIIKNDKGNASSRVLLTDDTTASETVDYSLEAYNEQTTNQFMTASFQEATTEPMDINTTEFYKENATKQISSTSPTSLDDNTRTTSPIVTTDHLFNMKSIIVDNKLSEETSVTPSNHLENMENPSIEPLYNRQQKLAIKNLKESSKRKAKKFNYDTDVMPSLGDYDYI